MANFLAWSHSRRKMYMECPKQLYHNAVADKRGPDRIDFVQTQAMKDGNAVDDALTRRIAGNVPLPPQYAPYEGMAQAVLAAPGIKYTQMQLALDRAFRPCGYKDWDNAWVRVIYDVAVINGTYAFLGDWKNGMIWPDNDQLKLFAATGFCIYPETEVIDTSYIWLKHGKTSDMRYTRKQLPEMWGELLPEVERMQVSFQTNHWPAIPIQGAKTCERCSVNAAKKCDKALAPYKTK